MQVWQLLSIRVLIPNRVNMNWQTWIHAQMQHVGRLLLWEVWKARNESVVKGKLITNNQIEARIHSLLEFMAMVFDSEFDGVESNGVSQKRQASCMLVSEN